MPRNLSYEDLPCPLLMHPNPDGSTAMCDPDSGEVFAEVCHNKGIPGVLTVETADRKAVAVQMSDELYLFVWGKRYQQGRSYISLREEQLDLHVDVFSIKGSIEEYILEYIWDK